MKKIIAIVSTVLIIGVLMSGCGKKEELQVEITSNDYNLVQIA